MLRSICCCGSRLVRRPPSLLQLSDFEKHIGHRRDGFVGDDHLFFKFEKGHQKYGTVHSGPLSSNLNEYESILVGLTPPVYGYHEVMIGDQSLSVLVTHRLPTMSNSLEETINGPFWAGTISSVIDRVNSVLTRLEEAAVKRELFCADWTPSELATLEDTAYLVDWERTEKRPGMPAWSRYQKGFASFCKGLPCHCLFCIIIE